MKYSIYISSGISIFLFLTTAVSTLANVQSEAIATLQRRTKIPVKLPQLLPNSEGDRTHLNISANADSYNVSFDYNHRL